MDDEPFEVYGVRKVWRPLRGEGVGVARCTVARRMGRMGLQGAVRGRRGKTTRVVVVHGERPEGRVNREFQVSHGLRHRRLCAAHRGWAGVDFTAHRHRPRCPRTGPA